MSLINRSVRVVEGFIYPSCSAPRDSSCLARVAAKMSIVINKDFYYLHYHLLSKFSLHLYLS